MSESLFTIHRHVINFEKFYEPIYLIPIGDVHHDAPLFARDKWNEFIAWAKTKPRCYFIGMGDYTDLASSSERKILRNPDLHESTAETIENLWTRLSNAFADDLKFSTGRWIGILEGNHHGVFSNGMTTSQLIAGRLKAKYLGYCGFIRLIFTHRTGKTMSLDVFAHHGRGSGRSAGSSVTNVEKLAEIAEADIFLSGHDHRKWVDYKRRLRLTKSQTQLHLEERKILLGRTGSFLKSYEPGKESYIVKAAMNPTDLGVIKIELTPKRTYNNNPDNRSIKCEDRTYIDIHASI